MLLARKDNTILIVFLTLCYSRPPFMKEKVGFIAIRDTLNNVIKIQECYRDRGPRISAQD